MAINNIPGVGPQNSDIAAAVAAPSAATIAAAVAAPSSATIASAVAAAVPTNSSIANAVAAAVPTNASITTIAQANGGAPKTFRGQTFTSNGNWTAPTGVNNVKVFLVGGGGGGYATTGSSGGGGGQVLEQFVAVSAGSNYAISIGAGGAGSVGGTGGAGTASSFGTNLLIAGGGGGGGGASSGYTVPNAGSRQGGAHGPTGQQGYGTSWNVAGGSYSHYCPPGGGSYVYGNGSGAGGFGNHREGGSSGAQNNGASGIDGFGAGGSYAIFSASPANSGAGGNHFPNSSAYAGGSGFCYLEWEA
jgi:hypothetical protein